MKLGIMQPYLFPYLGYFQLIGAVDTFVIYDDVQYIKRGWINRNNIQLNRSSHLFTFGVKRDTTTKPINQRFYSEDTYNSTKRNFIDKLFQSYNKAPYFNEVNKLVTEILSHKNLNVSEFNANCLRMVCDYMNIPTPFIFSSSLEREKNLKGQEAVIEINKLLGGHCYINAIGGMELYSPEEFEKDRIELWFIKTDEIKYPQFGEQFIPNLSIIDVLMFNSQKKIEELLNSYELVQGDG